MMKNPFYLTLKAGSVVDIFFISSFCLDFLVMQKNGLMRKRLVAELMTSQLGKQTIAIHIWPNILRSKGNQTMKSG